MIPVEKSNWWWCSSNRVRNLFANQCAFTRTLSFCLQSGQTIDAGTEGVHGVVGDGDDSLMGSFIQYLPAQIVLILRAPGVICGRRRMQQKPKPKKKKKNHCGTNRLGQHWVQLFNVVREQYYFSSPRGNFLKAWCGLVPRNLLRTAPSSQLHCLPPSYCLRTEAFALSQLEGGGSGTFRDVIRLAGDLTEEQQEDVAAKEEKVGKVEVTSVFLHVDF